MTAPARILNLSGVSVQVFADPRAACPSAAAVIARTIQQAVGLRGQAVIGLATGLTPKPVYAELVALHRAGEISFADVISYNLDEYYPISPLDRNSYRSYMHEHLFRHVDIAPNRAHVFDGTVPESCVAEHAAQYDRWIDADLGLDLQLLGIGRNGHIGFNEPEDRPVGDALSLPSRLVALHPVTLADAAKDFGAQDEVPRRALTVGVAPILAARSILLLAFGPAKADVVARALTGPITAQVPASLLRRAQGPVTCMLDESAARGLA